MLASLRNMFKVPDLRNKVLFTLLIIGVYLMGANIVVPGVNFSEIQTISAAEKSGGVLGFLNLFSGGALARAAIFGLGIMPYITSSIIVQLLQTVIPKFEQWREQGAVGQRKLTQATRYLTVALAVMQSSGLVFLFHSGELFGSGSNIDLIKDFTAARVLFIILVFTAGTAVVMWLAELITQRGIGNGMSILIFSNVVAAMPIYGEQVKADKGWFGLGVIIVVVLLLLVAIVFVEQGQRRIPVTFAKRVQGRRMYGGQSTYIPLKVNQSGVIPIIFASSVLYIPVLMSNIVPWTGFQNFVNSSLHPTSFFYIASDFVLIVAFTFFYVYIAFEPHQQAEMLRQQGGFVPGIRPGMPTEKYFSKMLSRLTVVGAFFLASVAVVPSILMALWNINRFPYYGTTLLIAVGVSLQTMQQIDSQLMMRNYEGFLKR